MPTQNWMCEKCDNTGGVEYKPHAGVWEVYQAINDDHKDKSPKCDGDSTTIRLGTPEK